MSEASSASTGASTGATSPASAGTGANSNGAAKSGRFQELLQQLRDKPLIPLLVGGAAAIAIVIAMLLWAGSPDYRVLYSNLSNADGGKIIATLDQQGVKYKFAQGGHALLVPADKVYHLRLQLAEQGLPSAGNVGFKIMDKEAFGLSQFAEQVNYLRGLQGELANSIEVLQPVSGARVHLALPKKSMFIRKREPAKATVVLTMKPGRVLDAGQVNAIVHMVASSVRDLAPGNVTVVDQAGRLLSRNGIAGGLDGSQLDYLRKVEERYQRRIQRILTPIVGAGNVHTQVTAQVDFSKREVTRDQYGPNQGDNPTSVRSRQESSSWSDDGNRNASGIPGALTNTAPGAAASPIANPPQDNAQADADGAPATAATGTAATRAEDTQHGRMQRHSTTNYELDHSITHVQHQLGTVQRLSVAVVVNYRDEEQKDGSIKEVPLDESTLNKINQLTREAMGFSTQRGDSLEVVNSAFRTPRAPAEPSWWQQLDWVSLLTTLGRYLLILIIAIVLYRVLVRPYLKRHLASLEPATPAPASDTATETGADADEAAPEPAPRPRPRPRRNRSTTYQDSLMDLKEMAKNDPAMIAMIVRNWMNRDGK